MKVKVGVGLTVPHPRFPYSSIRVDVSVEDEVAKGKAPQTIEQMRTWVHDITRREVVKASTTENDRPLNLQIKR